jgi:hypothetical protein
MAHFGGDGVTGRLKSPGKRSERNLHASRLLLTSERTLGVLGCKRAKCSCQTIGAVSLIKLLFIGTAHDEFGGRDFPNGGVFPGFPEPRSVFFRTNHAGS